MNRPDKEHQTIDATEFDQIHRILASEEPILPSSGFLTAVMDHVEDEARMPAPIPFPWKRSVPGILLVAGVFGWGVYELIRAGIPSLHDLMATQQQLPSAIARPLDQVFWVVLALVVSLASWILSRRLAGQSGLL